MGKKTKISLTIDPDTHSLFKNYCSENGMKVSTKIEQLIKELMQKE